MKEKINQKTYCVMCRYKVCLLIKFIIIVVIGCLMAKKHNLKKQNKKVPGLGALKNPVDKSYQPAG